MQNAELLGIKKRGGRLPSLWVLYVAGPLCAPVRVPVPFDECDVSVVPPVLVGGVPGALWLLLRDVCVCHS